jgi:uncharacterized protein (TIGR03435 family)
MRYVAIGVLVAAAIVVQVSAQEKPSSDGPQFEVASIRKCQGPCPTLAIPAIALSRRVGGVRDNLTVAALIQAAYGLEDWRVVGGPDWIREDYFEINATAGFDASFEQKQLMVRSLLRERFRLTTHVEQREMRFLALVLARGDGRLGPYIRRVDDPCVPEEALAVLTQLRSGESVVGSGAKGACDPVSTLVLLAQGGRGTRRRVLDQTGLTGKLVYDLRYRSLTSGDPSLPLFDIALEEQLGLKLEPRTGPVDVLVIDSVEPPTPN